MLALVSFPGSVSVQSVDEPNKSRSTRQVKQKHITTFFRRHKDVKVMVSKIPVNTFFS